MTSGDRSYRGFLAGFLAGFGATASAMQGADRLWCPMSCLHFTFPVDIEGEPRLLLPRGRAHEAVRDDPHDPDGGMRKTSRFFSDQRRGGYPSRSTNGDVKAASRPDETAKR